MLKDADIREPLFLFLEQEYGIIRIIEETRASESIADVIMVTPYELYGIEIKSDADSYARLSSQVKNYDECFDRNMAVVGTRHAEGVKKHIPEYWGIITVEETEDGIDFYIVRQPLPNPYMSILKKIRILWREELNRILKRHELPAYAQKSKEFVRLKLVEKVDELTLNADICDALFERDYAGIAERINAYRQVHSRRKRKTRKRRKSIA
ncbi:MAG: sce7726 family protein [Solobacterium sp.]|nr:sce7726 family protein [Solobacterium sp.]